MWPRPPRTTPSRRLGRRQFLAFAWPAPFVPFVVGRRPRSVEAATESGGYVVDVDLLYGVFGFHLDGALTQMVDPATGAPIVCPANIKGRESRSDIFYDWGRGTVTYDFRGETFFLRRVRIAHDVLSISESMRVDDAVSAMLNYREGRWPPQPDGSFRVAVDPRSGERTEHFDLGRFSSWAKPDHRPRSPWGRTAIPNG